MISVPERVKNALRDGRLLKNYRFNVLETDGTVDFTIDNDTLVYESVKFDERMCSGDTLKFGLCEGSSLEFQYFDWPNITGRQLQCFIDVQYIDAAGDPAWHTIPMGYFTVKKCSRQASTGIQKVTAYNKLQSEYLDANATDAVKQLVEDGEYGEQGTSIHTILNTLLNGYNIDSRQPTVGMGSFTTMRGRAIYDYPVCDANGNLNGYHIWIYYCAPVMSLDQSDFYYFTLNTANMLERARSYIWNSYKDYYVKISGTPYVMTLNDMAQSSAIVSTGRLAARGALSGYLFIGKDFLSTAKKTLAQSFGGQPDIYTDELSRCNEAVFMCPIGATIMNRTPTDSDIKSESQSWYDYNFFWLGYHPLIVAKENLSTTEKMILTSSEISNINAVTLRDLQAATFELNCQYGQLGRVTDLFEGIELNHTALYPADTLYPANDLYPGGVSETSFRSWYSKLWTDTVGEQSFRNLIITYKGLDGNNVPTDFVYETVVDPDGTTDYIMDDNWLFRNLVWTQAQIETYAAAMVTKMQSIKWFPFEMWAAGLPYVETGDMIEIMANDETHTSYVLQRQLSGIQNLQDTYINGTLDIF